MKDLCVTTAPLSTTRLCIGKCATLTETGKNERKLASNEGLDPIREEKLNEKVRVTG